MTESVDPFEAAARIEEKARLRREARMVMAALRAGVSRDHRGSLRALVAFFGPYALWGAIRAATYRWGPGLGPRLVHFFFSGPFGWYTGWILFLTWVWLMSLVSRRAPAGGHSYDAL